MIKRPLHHRFSDAVREDLKVTTIRDNPWPIGRSIMLYNWSGAPYRSKQIDVAAVEVLAATPIHITRNASGEMDYSTEHPLPKPLWECEGFDSQSDMDAWFAAKMTPTQTLTKCLMQFRLLKP